MKPVFLEFTDDEGKKTKTFTACSLKTGMMDNIFEIAEKAEEMEKDKLNIKEVREFYQDLKALIIDVFKDKFTYDQLNENVEQDELMRVFQELCNNIGGEIQKN